MLVDDSLIGADVVVLATPAFVSAGVVAAGSPQLGALLEEIEYATLTELTGLFLTRSAYQGVGPASCIADTERTAAANISAGAALACA